MWQKLPDYKCGLPEKLGTLIGKLKTLYCLSDRSHCVNIYEKKKRFKKLIIKWLYMMCTAHCEWSC